MKPPILFVPADKRTDETYIKDATKDNENEKQDLIKLMDKTEKHFQIIFNSMKYWCGIQI